MTTGRPSSLGWGDPNQDVTSAAMSWLDRYPLPSDDFPLTITDLYLVWPSQQVGSLLGKQVRLLVYTDADATQPRQREPALPADRRDQRAGHLDGLSRQPARGRAD